MSLSVAIWALAPRGVWYASKYIATALTNAAGVENAPPSTPAPVALFCGPIFEELEMQFY